MRLRVRVSEQRVSYNRIARRQKPRASRFNLRSPVRRALDKRRPRVVRTIPKEVTREMPIATINPATGETVRTYEAYTPAEIEDRLARAAAAFVSYRRTSLDERAAYMTRLAEIVEAEREELGRLMTIEMGKPLRAAIDEAAKCARACRHYAEHAAGYLRDDDVKSTLR